MNTADDTSDLLKDVVLNFEARRLRNLYKDTLKTKGDNIILLPSSFSGVANLLTKMSWISLAISVLSLFSLALANNAPVLQPPLITQPDRPQTIYYGRNERVTLKCQAKGVPKPSYQWQRDGKIVESDDQFIKFDSRTGTLEIPSFTEREEGMFMCLASNKVGGNVALSFSHPQKLLASRVESFIEQTGPPLEVNRNEYAYARLACTDQGEVVGDPNDITYKWYITKQSQQVRTDDGRLFISSDGTLHFTYTLQTDELEGSDTYHCGISSLKSRLIQLGPSTILNVQESSPAALRPVIVHHNDGLKAILATTAELECVFSGYDPAAPDRLPVIQWFDDAGKPIQGDGKKYTLQDKNRVLIIKDVQEDDDSMFECQGKTSAGSSRKQRVHLNVTSAPIWVKPPQSRTVPEGKNVEINCNARSLSEEEPPLLPQWYINGKEFAKVNKKNAALADDRKTLTFTNVTKANDILCVQCFVKNSIGQTMGDACLNVILPIKLTLDCDKCKGKNPDECSCTKWEISHGDSVEFRLTVTTDPGYTDKLTQEWSVHKEVYKLPVLPPHWNRDQIAQVYFLNTSDLSQEDFAAVGGSYFYHVYHSSDSADMTFLIEVKGVTPAPVVSSASVDMWIIGLVIGLVFLLIVIILIIFVIVCRKQQEGVYNLGKKETGAGLNPAKELKDKAFHDLSRPDYEDYEYPDKKPKGELEYDDVPIEGDDESLGEYGDEEDIHFNEDGSFIGNYSVKPTNNNRTTESTI